MTALTPHIRVLRALSLAFDETAETLQRFHVNDPVAGAMLHVAAAFEQAADALEAEEQALEQRLAGPQPKGY